MLQSLLGDRRAASCGGASRNAATLGRSGLSGAIRTLQASIRERIRQTPADPLSDHILQDIGLSRADVQAMTL